MKGRRTLVTGGAGFIGSHVVDRLVALGAEVVVYDNFSTGFREHLAVHVAAQRISVVEGDTRDLTRLSAALHGVDTVFHFQANADVRGGREDTRIDLEQNTLATWNVLEAARWQEVRCFVFASSAAVYGEPETFPTPEGCTAPQTSLYGASKLAGEAMIQAYSEYFGMQSFIFRFVSWIGERYSHGVIADFMTKLQKDPRHLQILGDGAQRKSYLYVTDGIDAIFTALEKCHNPRQLFNLGHDDSIDVREVAIEVISALGLPDVELAFGGGARGWLGDSPLVHLDTSAIKQLLWQARTPIRVGIQRTVHYLREHPEILR